MMFLCIEIYDHYTTGAVFNDMKHVLKRIVSKFMITI